MSTEKQNEGVRSVNRALDILMAFRHGDRSLTAGELLKRVALSRPTLYRLLKTLEQRGFIIASNEPQQFQLGPSVAYLAHVWGTGMNLAELAQPILRQLWEETGETVALNLKRGQERVCVAELPSQQPLSFKNGVGHSANVALGASGRAILAFLAEPTVYLDERTPAAEHARQLDELARVRTQGYATSRDELIKGAVAVAVPVFAGADQVLGSLAVYGPSARIEDSHVQRFVDLLKEASAEFSRLAGAVS